MDTDLTPQQETEAQRIFAILKQTSDADLMALARLLAAKPDHQLLGATEFQVRDAVHKIGAQALQIALHGRKKGGMTAPAAPARTATKPHASTDARTGPSKAASEPSA
jgi:hypothetical protein